MDKTNSNHGLPLLSEVKEVPVEEQTDYNFQLSRFYPSIKQKKLEIDRLICEFMDELSSMVKRKVGHDLQLDCHVGFGYEGFSGEVYVTMYTPNNEMSYESLDEYVHSLDESPEFKGMDLLFYFRGIGKKNEEDQ